jgi:hypothetical protein
MTQSNDARSEEKLVDVRPVVWTPFATLYFGGP